MTVRISEARWPDDRATVEALPAEPQTAAVFVLPVVASMRVAVTEFASVMFTLAGMNCAVTPGGSDEADRLTIPVKPAKGVIVTW